MSQKTSKGTSSRSSRTGKQKCVKFKQKIEIKNFSDENLYEGNDKPLTRKRKAQAANSQGNFEDPIKLLHKTALI
jgi:hypothetical protein